MTIDENDDDNDDGGDDEEEEEGINPNTIPTKRTS